MFAYRYNQNVLWFFKTKTNQKTGSGWAVSIFSRSQIWERKDGQKWHAAEMTASNCGSCPLRKGGCYTHTGNISFGLQSQIRAIKRRFDSFEQVPKTDIFPLELAKKLSKTKFFRFGVYGCPTNVPLSWVAAIAGIIQYNRGKWTGYTHEWHRPEIEPYMRYFMASVHTKGEAFLCEAMGYRYFWASTEKSAPAGVVLCPSSAEFEALRGKKIPCSSCGLCNGTSGKGRSIYIPLHGTAQKTAAQMIGANA